MHEEPTVQPMMHPRLGIQQAPLVAPTLHFLHPRVIRAGHPRAQMAKSFPSQPRFSETQFFTTPGLEVGQELALNELGQRSFRGWIGYGIDHASLARFGSRNRGGTHRRSA